MRYDRIGATYRSTRRADPRIAAAIHAALPAGGTILNVGAGTGSYEPEGFSIVAVEPSSAMIAQREPSATHSVRAIAESLPFAERSFDAVLGVLTMHHWRDTQAGIEECLRVARDRVVFFTWDPEADGFWLARDYFPEILDQSRATFPTIDALRDLLGGATVTTVQIPHDCEDGFLGAFWRRPEAYLNKTVRDGISTFALLDGLEPGLDRLRTDLESGDWHRRNTAIEGLDSLDLGYRLVVARVAG